MEHSFSRSQSELKSPKSSKKKINKKKSVNLSLKMNQNFQDQLRKKYLHQKMQSSISSQAKKFRTTQKARSQQKKLLQVVKADIKSKSTYYNKKKQSHKKKKDALFKEMKLQKCNNFFKLEKELAKKNLKSVFTFNSQMKNKKINLNSCENIRVLKNLGKGNFANAALVSINNNTYVLRIIRARDIDNQSLNKVNYQDEIKGKIIQSQFKNYDNIINIYDYGYLQKLNSNSDKSDYVSLDTDTYFNEISGCFDKSKDCIVYSIEETCNGGEITDPSFINASYSKKNKKIRTQWTIHDWKNIFLQLANGVKSIHDVDIIHRDIKPDNIMLKEHYFHNIKPLDKSDSYLKYNPLTIKLIDFGISISKDNMKEVLKQEIKDGKTERGSNYFQAQEILQNNVITESYDFELYKKVDVFALGIVFFKLFVKKPKNPFDLYNFNNSVLKDEHCFNKKNKLNPEIEEYNMETEHVEKIYQLIQDMIQYEPKQRLNINQVITRIKKI